MVHEVVSVAAPVLAAAPPVIVGLKKLLTDVAGWIALLQVPVAILVTMSAGYKYMNAEDPHEKKLVRDKFKNLIIGIAIIGNAPWIGSKILSYF